MICNNKSDIERKDLQLAIQLHNEEIQQSKEIATVQKLVSSEKKENEKKENKKKEEV